MSTRPVRLAVDHMLVKLGRYLRCLGHDADWRPGERTQDLIRRANAEERVFVTRNTRLTENYPRPAACVRVVSDDPVEQLHEVVSALDLDATHLAFTRCVVCNVELEPVTDPRSVASRVPPRVRERYARFWTCPSCATVFWKGTHVRNTCAKLGLPDLSETVGDP